MLPSRLVIWALAFCCGVATLHAQVKRDASSNSALVEKRGIHSKMEELGVKQTAPKTIALAIINSVIEDSDRYKSETLRVRIQARAASLMWPSNPERGRELFVRAFKLAQLIDEDDTRASQEARRKAMSGRPGAITMIPATANLRSEVLKLAAARDTALGESLLSEMDQPTQDNSTSETGPVDPTEPGSAVARRLEVALEQLDSGDFQRAKAFAQPALSTVTSPGIIFLCSLRARDPRTADTLYSQMLAAVTVDPAADATAISLLSSYVFSPTVLVTATRRGRVSNQFGDSSLRYEAPSTIRDMFLRAASTVLLRPLSPQELDQTIAGRAGTYFTIARLLPMFQRYASAYVEPLNARLSSLATDAPETFRNGQDNMLRLGLETTEPDKDGLTDIQSQLERVGSSAERDLLCVRAIRIGSATGDPRIGDYAEKIEDESLKQKAKSFVELVLVRDALKKRNIEKAITIVNGGHLSPLHRVWVLTSIATLVKSDSARSLELLEDSLVEAAKIDPTLPDHAYALTSISSAFLNIDRSRAWSVTADAIKAVNTIPGYSTDNVRLTASLRTRNVMSVIDVPEPSFNIETLFDLLAHDDLDLALSLADTIKEEAPRSAVRLAIADSILSSKNKPALPSGKPSTN